jgi:hypothetical protein
MVGIVSSGIRDVVEHFFSVEPVPLRDGEQTNGAEGAFGIDVETLALSTAHADRQLACHRERVADLRLSGTEFAEELCDRSRLYSPCRFRRGRIESCRRNT